MLPLAATSFNRAIRWLGAARWQALHRAVYAVALLACCTSSGCARARTTFAEDELLHVGHVQAHGRLVEHVERVRRAVATAGDVVAHLAEFGHQLDALRLAA
jgi:hypothetical protein